MQLPEFLSPFQKEAEEFLARGCAKDIEFSGGTYQVQVVDPQSKEAVWAFIQLDNRGQIKDSFCSCEESENVNACVHVAVAFLRIYLDHSSPLHQRFERSLWNKLCRLYADRMGAESNLLKLRDKRIYTCTSFGGKCVFYVEGKNNKALARLKDIIEHPRKETEETSLKFSNLSQEEITLWREGKPSSQLSYELSFWNDLAKWMLIAEEAGADYKISFEFAPNHLPNFIQIKFPEFEIGFYLSEANLPLIIPSLAMVKSPLKVHNAPQETIKRIVYDKNSSSLLIESKKSNSQDQAVRKGGISIDGWLYIRDDGFYMKDKHSLLAAKVLSGKQISQALNEHFSTIKSLLEGTRIQQDPIQVSYAIAFDNHWNLHMTCYLFNVGDLNQGDSHYFGDWAYLDDDGFYRLEGMQFDEVETIVPSEEVAEFIRQHRSWLNTQDGFQTHIASVEAQMSYHLSEDNYLTFSRKVSLPDETTKTKEFGPWVYISGQGFYAKINTNIGLPLRPGIALGSDQIPLFIRMNKDELQLVPGFFSVQCPVTRAGLNIKLNKNDLVTVTPEYEIHPDYQGKSIKFFDDYLYVQGEGFHELPVDHRLPERFRHANQIEKDNLTLFLTFELVSLRRYATYIDPRLVKPESLRLVATSIKRKSPSSKSHYLLKLKYETERGAVAVTQLWHAIKQKKRFFFDEAGLFDLEEKRFNWLRMLEKKQIDLRSHLLQLSNLELIRLNAFEEIELKKSKGEDYTETKNLLEELLQFRVSEEPDIKGLNSSLRPYQILGVRWLWFLYQHGLSGILCDDMGLGKTHQTMALIAAIRNSQQASENPTQQHFLVVCPTSVIYHWQEKLHQFLPGVRVCTFHGSLRSLEDFHNQYDILLTSYGIWRIENELLSKVKFELAIFDEIQIAKNHNSRIYSSLVRADAQMRLGLTGTPIENHLRELKSLFDIVLPTYMPTDTDYREFFVKPIEKEGNPERRRMLSRLIKPFIMRRKKGDVLLDLPEKIEEIAHCELLPEQEQLYVEVLNKSRQAILEELQDESNPVPYMHIFALLTSLKQICNHPAVYFKTPEKYKEYQSGKWELFVEYLSEARESQQKIVVFSQYLHMMDIIEEYLKESSIGYATIRGSTQDRAEQLQRFNHDPDCEVFVASLQAAGLGIDLTAGSVVVHYDRWWNAARENQATDRVHRIGQTRGVQVFKLVTIGTFEEKIDALIAKKGQLMEDVVGIDDHRMVKQFSRQEIIQLLQYVGAK
jgi:SNF2 family DNA or RNA helicase/predicted small metal-binding protein